MSAEAVTLAAAPGSEAVQGAADLPPADRECNWCSPAGDPSRRQLWSQQPALKMKGGLKLFWNIIGPTGLRHQSSALQHGFSRITLAMPWADYGGDGSERISVPERARNPWNRPPFFETSIKRTLAGEPSSGVYVNDIEISLADADVAWTDSVAREASGAANFADFKRAYYREWANWYALTSQYTRAVHPGSLVGLYGRQVFNRDYWGFLNEDLATFERNHADDAEMWRAIDGSVDFYVADIYLFYDEPGSVHYMAANVEENFLRSRVYGDKPLYAYEWLRYHDSNRELGEKEIATPYLVEAMAIVPFFSGAKGIALWGAEAQPELRDEQVPSDNFPAFMHALARVSALSEDIGRARLVIDEPARTLWRAERPLVRRLVVSSGHCIAMAVNPWQAERAVSQADVLCGDRRYGVAMNGRATTIAEIRNGRVTLR